MSKIRHNITTLSAVSLLALSVGSANLLAQPTDEAAEFAFELPSAEVITNGEFINVKANIAFDRAVLRISGPQGYTATFRTAGGDSAFTADLLVDAEPAESAAATGYSFESDGLWHTLPNGEYRYEIDLIVGDRLVGREIGTFWVEAGLATESRLPAQSFRSAPSVIQRIAGAMLDWVIPSASAQVLNTDNYLNVRDSSNDNITYVRYEADTTSIGDYWRVGTRAGSFWWNRGGLLGPNAPANNRMTLSSGGNLGINTTVPFDRLHVVNPASQFSAIRIEGTGNAYRLRTSDSEFALLQVSPSRLPFRIESEAPSNSIYVAASGNVGLGTSSPSARLQVAGDAVIGGNLDITGDSLTLKGTTGFPEISVQRTGAFGSTAVGLATDSSGRMRLRVPAGNTRMVIEPTQGNVGIGTINPDAALHILRSDGTAEILLQEFQAIDVNQQFIMRSNGNTGFRFENTRDGSEWQFRTGGQGGSSTAFLINFAPVSGPEFSLSSAGNLFLKGNVIANGVQLTSSRMTKTNIMPLDTHAVLAKLDALEISQWRYNHQDESSVHVGPMAEDFHEIFGLSDGKTLNMIDTNGVTFAAIQALSENNHELRERVAILEDYILQSKSN